MQRSLSCIWVGPSPKKAPFTAVLRDRRRRPAYGGALLLQPTSSAVFRRFGHEAARSGRSCFCTHWQPVLFRVRDEGDDRGRY